MSKVAKSLMILLIISAVLNVVLLISVVRLKSTSAEETSADKIIEDNYDYTKGSQPKNVSQTKKMIKDQRPTFKMLNAMPSDYLEKKLTLYGFAKITSYYNWGYDDANISHYSVKLADDDYTRIHIYFPKTKKNKKLFELLGQAGSDNIALKVEAIELRSRYESYCSSYLGEGLNWEVMK